MPDLDRLTERSRERSVDRVVDREAAKFQCNQSLSVARHAVYAGSGCAAGEHASRNAPPRVSLLSLSVAELRRC